LIVCLKAILWKALPSRLPPPGSESSALLAAVPRYYRTETFEMDWLAGPSLPARSKLSILSNGHTPLVQLRTADCRAEDCVLP
jgi:hypothetical protein